MRQSDGGNDLVRGRDEHQPRQDVLGYARRQAWRGTALASVSTVALMATLTGPALADDDGPLAGTSAITSLMPIEDTLTVSSDDELGDPSAALTFNGGTLKNTAKFTTKRDITLEAGGGTLHNDRLLTVSGTISGTGSLTKKGGNGLILQSKNTYTGGTFIDNNRIEVMTTGALGTGPVAVNSGDPKLQYGLLHFRNDASAEALDITNSVGRINFYDDSTAGDASITNTRPSSTDFSRINFYDDSTAGNASFTNNGGGISFNGNSTASNATIANVDGDLNFYDDASAGNALIHNIDGDIYDDYGGYVQFLGNNTADDASIRNGSGSWLNIALLTSDGIAIGSLSGNGLVTLGSKALTLGGLGQNDTIGGVIQDGPGLEQAPENDGPVGSGGSLIKIGTGTLTLTGMNTYTGPTSVEAGTLVVNGSIADSTVAVNDTARLEGTGTVGGTTVASGGTIAPGNSIGTLTVDGDVTFAAGSTYEVEINPALESDLINASGAATINGGTVHTIKAAGVYTPGSRWTIIGAEGGVDGTFDELTQNMPFVDLFLGYDPDAVYLEVARNEVEFCDVALTDNQCATGDGLETTGIGNPVYDAVAAIPDEGSARQALDALSGEIHASAKSAMLEDSRFVREAATARVRAAFGDVAAPSSPVMSHGSEGGLTPQDEAALAREGKSARVFTPAPSETDGLAVWAHGFGSWGEWDSDSNAAAFDRSIGGLFIGADAPIGDWRVGALAGYSRSSFDVDDRNSSGEADSYHLGLYGGTQWGKVGFRAGAAYTWHNIDTSRSISFPGFAESAEASYDAATAQVFGELGYRIDTAAAAFEPFANLAYVNVDTDGFTEEGGAAALTVDDGSTDTTFTTLGVRASTGFTLGSMNATARGMLGWRHAFGDTTPLSTHAFAGGDAFAIAGVPIAENALALEAGLDLALNDSATLGLSYNGQIASDAQDHGFKADLSVRF